MEEDIETVSFDEKPAAKPLNPGAKAVVDHFTYGPEDVDKLAETPLAYTEVCEPLLKELYNVAQKRKEIVKTEKGLKEELTSLAGLERGMLQRGSFGAKLADTKGKTKTDWKKVIQGIKAWAKDNAGKEAAKEIDAIVKQFTSTGEDGVSITPYMVGQQPDNEDTEE